MIVKSANLERSYRQFKCVCCGNTDSYEGYKICIPSQQNGIWLHKQCYKKLVNDTYEVIQGDTIKNSSRCINHTTTIICKVEDAPYFCINGYIVIQCMGKYRKVANVNTSAYSSGHIVKKAFKEGYKVFVNEKQITSFSEYKKNDRFISLKQK